ncbi:hypothetical protein ACHAWF_016550 [Thalassiosira exigua]
MAIPLWLDADPSGLFWSGLDCDDDLALLVALALHKRRSVDLQGLSICGGNAPLKHTWRDARALWEHADGFNVANIAPIKGYGWRSMRVGVGLLRFYNGIVPDSKDSQDASKAIVDRSRDKTLGPINVLMLGPPTNLAKALDLGLDPAGISHVYLMGGELTGQTLDLNFRSDRGGARAIVESDIPKTIISIQACAQTAVAESFLERIRCPSMAACALLPKMRQQIRLMPKFVNPAVVKRLIDEQGNVGRWTPSPSLDRGFIPWDIVALLALSHEEEFAEWEYHRVRIAPCDQGEPCDETMDIVEDYGNSFDGKNWSGVVRTPHRSKYSLVN